MVFHILYEYLVTLVFPSPTMFITYAIFTLLISNVSHRLLTYCLCLPRFEFLYLMFLVSFIDSIGSSSIGETECSQIFSLQTQFTKGRMRRGTDRDEGI